MKTVSGQSAGHRKDATAYAAEFLREEYRQDMLGHLKFSDVVVLDDLGSEGISKWTRDDILFPVYAAEFLRELPVIFTGCARERIRS